MGEDDKGGDLGKLIKVILTATQGKKKPSYSYQQSSGGFGGRRAITFIAVIVIAVVGFSLANSWTGNMIYTGGLETRVNDLGKSLQDLQSKVASLTSEIEVKNTELANEREKSGNLETDLVNTKNNLIDCTDREDRLKNDFNTCSGEVMNLTDDIETKMNNYRSLVRNTVRGVCCSVSDILSKKTRSFDVEGNEIFCADEGDHEVNCGTGETNY
ncbi:MAG: hypothetical protein JW754_05340 [Candidatus Aenigmarchaeota archaeon]|nr:hypothetical protein [Candidatus Aenigmarchaeota archaeon]